jgi:hypothetical protein
MDLLRSASQSSEGQFDLEYKFAVGQMVVLAPRSSWSAAVGDHVVRHLISQSDADADNPRYRAKSVADSQERIVLQSDLTLSEDPFPKSCQ